MFDPKMEEELRTVFENMHCVSEEHRKRGKFGEYLDDNTNKLWFTYRAGAIQMQALMNSRSVK